MPPLSLYIHIPWCIKKCPYCDFNSHKKPDVLPEQQYIDKLLADFRQDLIHVQNREINTIFIGGGTPSLFSAKQLGRLLLEISKLVTFRDDIEITMEVNPASMEHGKFQDYKDIGINRISLGVQSFNDKHLKVLGRVHDASAAKTAINEIVKTNFNSFNIDLMHGLPNQTIPEAMDDLQQALSFDVPHLSWYQLTIEPNTFFHYKPPTLPKEDALYEIETSGKEYLLSKGFSQYEVSAFSKSQTHQCQHNLNYWLFGDYLGIGAGAHGKITTAKTMAISRYWKTKHPKLYLVCNHTFIDGDKGLSNKDIILEFMLNALRLNGGFSLRQFSQYTNIPNQEILPILQSLENEELLCINNDNVYCSAVGAKYLNEVLEYFM
ncbi:MAG: YggW family oxidoreductase [Thiotrichales bacterium]|nr:MAG: YggW family oxidoreductase [Thiotrichales bacterium]